ncbi:MAG: hypothetical protein MUE44_10570 [Oscillatoriaceae cyanobacterium Prado104]|nr:hypothetical protein [Oscillatoriaceae cyanobacterium Prado104]
MTAWISTARSLESPQAFWGFSDNPRPRKSNATSRKLSARSEPNCLRPVN